MLSTVVLVCSIVVRINQRRLRPSPAFILCTLLRGQAPSSRSTPSTAKASLLVRIVWIARPHRAIGVALEHGIETHR